MVKLHNQLVSQFCARHPSCLSFVDINKYLGSRSEPERVSRNYIDQQDPTNIQCVFDFSLYSILSANRGFIQRPVSFGKERFKSGVEKSQSSDLSSLLFKRIIQLSNETSSSTNERNEREWKRGGALTKAQLRGGEEGGERKWRMRLSFRKCKLVRTTKLVSISTLSP